MNQGDEKVLKYDYLKFHESPSDQFATFSLISGIGQLILTNKRLVFVNFGFGKTLLGINAGAKYAKPDKLSEGLARKGSFEIPFNEILDLQAKSIMMEPILIIKRRDGDNTKWYKFMPTRRNTAIFDNTMAHKWVNAFNGVKSNINPALTQNQQTVLQKQYETKVSEQHENAEEYAAKMSRIKEINDSINLINAEINENNERCENARKELTRKYGVSGELTYSIFRNNLAPSQLQGNIDRIQFIDREIEHLRGEIANLKAQVPQGGVLSQIKDKAIAAGKTVKHDIEIYGLERKKKQGIADLGQQLLNCYQQGINVHAELSTVCQEMSGLYQQVTDLENKLSSLRQTKEGLTRTLADART